MIPQELDVAIAEGGNVAVTWSNVDPELGVRQNHLRRRPGTEIPSNALIRPSSRPRSGPAGGSFTPAKRISPPRFEHPPPPEGETELEKEEREEKEEEIDKKESKKSAAGARIAIDSSGNAVAVWSYFDGEDLIIQSAVRPAGETFFDPPEQVSGSGENAGDPVSEWTPRGTRSRHGTGARARTA